MPHAIGLSSGTDAVLAALMALDIGPGDEVITPTYSFFATAGCVVRVGAKPVLVDIEPGTFNIDVDATRAAITPRTKAIIPVHLFGQSAELAPIVAMARAARHRGDRGRGAGDRQPVSRPPRRHVGRDRLLLVFPEQESRRVRRRGLRDHHRRRPGEETEVDSHARDGAEVLPSPRRRQLPHRRHAGRGVARQAAAPRRRGATARRANAARYRALFADAGLDEVTLPVEAPDRTHIYNQFVIRVPERDRLKKHLDAAGIGTEIYYPVPFHLQQCFADLGYKAGAFPVAEAAATSSLALPIYPELTPAQQSCVVGAIRSFYRGVTAWNC